jgi:hypothetical protein
MNIGQVGNSTVITALGAPDGHALFYYGAPGPGIGAPEAVTPPPRVKRL